jgi:hypothetical protein
MNYKKENEYEEQQIKTRESQKGKILKLLIERQEEEKGVSHLELKAMASCYKSKLSALYDAGMKVEIVRDTETKINWYFLKEQPNPHYVKDKTTTKEKCFRLLQEKYGREMASEIKEIFEENSWTISRKNNNRRYKPFD